MALLWKVWELLSFRVLIISGYRPNSALHASFGVLHCIQRIFLQNSACRVSIWCLSLSLSGGGISSDLEDRRKQGQNKRKNQITDATQLKSFPCKRFRKGKCTHGEKCCYSHDLEQTDQME
ncbi:unnamed protein product [Oncorhynchus mykiss]|uniref:C3H1-type domain-containing protein n=1 Tax=Oncorhynchus mykiss TaxID=8022 RepID=A0A060Z8D6_ONCMY|nr:unnamed protein product [Oncorhynchus mykiss]